MDDKPHNPRISDTLEPVLEMNEFQEESASILDSAKEEASKIIERAKAKALEIIERERRALSIMEGEFQGMLEKEMKIEKETLDLNTKKELKRLEAIQGERIEQAVNYILARLLPRKEA